MKYSGGNTSDGAKDEALVTRWIGLNIINGRIELAALPLSVSMTRCIQRLRAAGFPASTRSNEFYFTDWRILMPRLLDRTARGVMPRGYHRCRRRLSTSRPE